MTEPNLWTTKFENPPVSRVLVQKLQTIVILFQEGLMYKCFVSLCCGHLGAMPYAQAVILNMTKPYLRSSILVLDKTVHCLQ